MLSGLFQLPYWASPLLAACAALYRPTCYITAFFLGYDWLCRPDALRAMAKDRKNTTSWPQQ